MLLVLSATACWFVAYIVMHLNVLVLRRRHPDWARPYRSPWFPLPQLFGGLAMLYCLFNLSPDPALTRALYGGGGRVGLALAAPPARWLKGVVRVRLFERVL
jgi:amino acid transporter